MHANARDEGRIFVFAGELDRVLAGKPAIAPIEFVAVEPPASDALTIRNTAGRPPEYDWVEILIEACAFVYRNGTRGMTYTKVENAIQTWHTQKYGRAPAMSTLHEKIKRLVDRLKQEDSTEK
jgi:hypothetical protein